MRGPVRERLSLRDLWEYFAPEGWATQWYWPEGGHGKMWNLLHGLGWKVM